MTTPSPSILVLPSRSPDREVRYGDFEDGVIDVYRPAPTADEFAAVLVVLVHGGFWRARYDRSHLRPLACELAKHGAAVAIPEFRRVGGGGEWPVIGLDVDAALRAIESWPGSTTGTPDGCRIVVVGHSAGGHLALWWAGRSPSARLARIVALAPVSDLRAAAADRLGNGAVQELLGGEPSEVPEQFADADPLRRLPDTVTVRLIQGECDEDVPAALNRRVATTHDAIRYAEVPGVDHLSLVDPRTAACRDHVLPAVLAPSRDRAPGSGTTLPRVLADFPRVMP